VYLPRLTPSRTLNWIVDAKKGFKIVDRFDPGSTSAVDHVTLGFVRMHVVIGHLELERKR
jgi:hypothetical protein